MRLTGSGILQIIPRKSPSGAWTSARIESTASYTPAPNKVTRFSALLRFGDAPQAQQQGIWPAFWMLGQSSRSSGVPWPECVGSWILWSGLMARRRGMARRIVDRGMCRAG